MELSINRKYILDTAKEILEFHSPTGFCFEVMDKIKAGEADYAFVEVMCCPGGCIGGGGQPYITKKETRMARIKAIYEVDADMPLRKSHANPAVQELYKDFLKEPLGEKSHHLLHTHYQKRGL